MNRKINYYRGKDFMKKFCKNLKEHPTRIISYEKKKIIPLTKEEKINYNDQQFVIYARKNLTRVIKNITK